MSSARLTTTGQRWVNELLEFFFSVHYKPGKQNITADTLSHTPEQMYLEHIQFCTEIVSVKMVNTLLDSLSLALENQEPVTICLKTASIKKQANILDNLAITSKSFTIDDIKKGQKREYWISRVKEILKQPTRLSPRHRRSDSKEVQQLLWKEGKLFISDDDVLYHKNKEQHQMLLPHALKEAVYRELHINMTHLGADKTLQLIRERIYWLKMEEALRHFINHQCPCVKQKKPHPKGKGPLLSITS